MGSAGAQKDDAAVIINANLCCITLYPVRWKQKIITNWGYFVAQPEQKKNEIHKF